MQMVKKIILTVFAVWLTVLFFMPKSELYYRAEKALAKQDIKLNEKSIEEGLFSLSVKKVTVYIKGIPLINIEELNVFTLLFYTSLSIEDLIVDEALHAKIPSHTKELHIKHQLFRPMTLTLDANGSFGEIVGNIDLAQRTIHIDFVETKDISMIQASLTKGEKGWIYEKSF
ncbi:MAG TPA: hypothetical protein EYG93_02235 [Sulfurospirillum arcachonense]|nr:hypothetical protein [Sulfurospirillum arcachonense]